MWFAESVNSPEGRTVPEKKVNRSRDELRELWRTAIKQQILLQRMEKENLKLKGEINGRRWRQRLHLNRSFQACVSIRLKICMRVCLRAHIH